MLRLPSQSALLLQVVVALTQADDFRNCARIPSQKHLKCAIVDALQNVFDLVKYGHGVIRTSTKVDDVLNIAGKVIASLLRADAQALFCPLLADRWATEHFST